MLGWVVLFQRFPHFDAAASALLPPDENAGRHETPPPERIPHFSNVIYAQCIHQT